MSGTMTYLFANMLLNSRLQGVFSSILIAPLVAISIGGVFVSRRFGLKSTFLLGTWGSMTMMAIMFVVGPDPNVPAVQEELENRKEVRTGKGPHLNGAAKAAAGEAV